MDVSFSVHISGHDVVQLTENACEHMKEKIIHDIKLLGEKQADFDSSFYQSLEDCIMKVESPVHNVGSPY